MIETPQGGDDMADMDGDKQRLLDNIAYLLQKSGKKIGEVEEAAGVSVGYISRITKDTRAKPGLEFVKGIARFFHISMDQLMYQDLTTASSTEKYLFHFLQKLDQDTLDDRINWTIERPEALAFCRVDENGHVGHPLLTKEHFIVEGPKGVPLREEKVGFNSRTFNEHTAFAGNWFYVRMPEGYCLYLASIKDAFPPSPKNELVIEVWMVSPEGHTKYICSSLVDSSLGPMTAVLYQSVLERSRNPKLEPEYQHVIDAFMSNSFQKKYKEETHGKE